MNNIEHLNLVALKIIINYTPTTTAFCLNFKFLKVSLKMGNKLHLKHCQSHVVLFYYHVFSSALFFPIIFPSLL